MECSLGNTKLPNKILSQFWAFESTDLVKLIFGVIICTSGCVLVVITGVLGLSLACSECDTCLTWIVFYKKGCIFHSTSVHKQSWTEELQEALMLGIFFLDRRNRDSEFEARTCPWLTPHRRDVIEFLQICALPSACALPVQTGTARACDSGCRIFGSENANPPFFGLNRSAMSM